MQKLMGIAVAVLGLVLLWAGVQTAEEAKDLPGKAVFLQYKCNSCHSVEAQKIAVKKSEDAEADAEAEEDKTEPPDLSGVGLEQNAVWMSKYLTKKEKLHDKTHRKKFRGTAPELKDLTTWLSTLKTEPKGKKGTAKAADKRASEPATK